MTDIPRARRLLADACFLMTRAKQMVQEAESLMTRPSPIRKAPRSSARITPVLAGDIQAYALKHPRKSLKDIGAHFKVDGGRVSEILRGLR